MYRLTVEDGFSAAHSLREYRGKCENLHGHNWKVKAVFEAGKLNPIGMIIDFKDAKKLLKESMEEFDHKFINDNAKFKTINPTTENIARHIFETISAKLPEGVSVKKVTAWETPGSGASYIRD
ncbi:MAG: 6-carboxytetrahydropterin synthase QueD [Planctomycetota bacterium]|jgi:6-pyruvoyltetrahydropterin/6-carboxytetrahydropterin synthase